MDFKIYFQNKSLKKIPKQGLHFEQKTTPDLLWCVAATLLDVTKLDNQKTVSDKEDIRKSPLFSDLMSGYFSKPAQTPEAEKEYDKVSKYQLGVMEYAGLIEKVGLRPNRYKIHDREALEYIAINDLNASKFLTEYTDKFVKENGLWAPFEDYLRNPSTPKYEICKESYWNWAKTNTDVKTSNPQHSYRVYNKIFNVLCYKYRVPGQSGSRVTSGVCPYSYLIYNRDNFRDKDKPSDMTRQEYFDTSLSQIDSEGFVETLLKKAKDSISRKYGDSEIREPDLGYLPQSGVHVHHIVPRSHNQKFSLDRENLIALTPGQHLSRAHPKGNTRLIDPKYQAICFAKKLEHIVDSAAANEEFYDYSKFIEIVNSCYGWSLDSTVSSDLVSSMISNKIAS